jgi:hypothetical protein
VDSAFADSSCASGRRDGRRQARPAARLGLDLLDERRFGGGMAYLRYGITEVRRDDGR